MPGFGIVPPGSAEPGGQFDLAAREANRAPFWGLNEAGVTPNEDPLYYTDPWDTFFINDIQMPGKCWIEGSGISAIEVERKKGKGTSGARISFFGYEPKEFAMLCRIATPEQWQLYQQIEDKFWAGPLKTDRPPQLTVKVSYPDLLRLRVFQAVLIAVPPAETSDVEGAKNFRWKFHEQVKQKPHKAKSAAGALPPEDPQLPASSPLNFTPALPSQTQSNMSLDGPDLTSHAGAQ